MSSPKKNVARKAIAFIATDLAWAAGILDADGCVYAHKTKVCTWQFGIEVGNTDSRMIQHLVDISGGGNFGRRREKPPRKDFFYWRLSGHKGEGFIRGLRPYLIVKQEQVDLLLELISTGSWRGCRGVPEDLYSQRLELMQRLKSIRNNGCVQEIHRVIS
jgi:hypothetical protein